MAEPDLASPLTEDAPAPLPNAAPDWASLSEEVNCPLCGYNLRGLSDSRCPECGFCFTWAELLDRENTVHPYLFEHHPERNLWSLWRTFFGGTRPLKFWTLLTPGHPIRPRRLVASWILLSLIGAMAFIAASLYGPISVLLTATPINGAFFSSMHTPITDLFFYWMREVAPSAAAHIILLVLWPWITFLTLMIFQISMRRAGVRKMHVLRVVLYSGNLVLWAGLASVLVAALLLLMNISPNGEGLRSLEPWCGLVILGGWMAMTCSLYFAYRRYLRFDHPLSTIVASQVIAILSIPTGLVLIQESLSLFNR